MKVQNVQSLHKSKQNTYSSFENVSKRGSICVDVTDYSLIAVLAKVLSTFENEVNMCCTEDNVFECCLMCVSLLFVQLAKEKI